jgi:hypothetical protein
MRPVKKLLAYGNQGYKVHAFLERIETMRQESGQ